ncbi:MAG: Tim44 domain-containing protein [Alphaproteobacteria bacterium]|nr:Tim44 domain-containing protein [Alphaproteobacteria bacterium]
MAIDAEQTKVTSDRIVESDQTDDVEMEMNQVADAGSQWLAILLFVSWWALLGLLDLMFPRAGSEILKPPVGAVRNSSGEGAASPVRTCGIVSRADPSFDEQHFLHGAASAYETILHAYAKGDIRTLRLLLSPEVTAAFETAIDERHRCGVEMDITFVCLKEALVTNADVAGTMAEISVRFVAQLISASHSASGALVDGDPHRIIETSDVWTFSRDLSQRNPQWRLVATDEDDRLKAAS